MINEKMGVPDGIFETAKELHHKIMVRLETIIAMNIEKIISNKEKYSIEARPINNVTINDENFNELGIVINFDYFDNPSNKPVIMISAGMGTDISIGAKNKNLILEYGDSNGLSIHLAINKAYFRRFDIEKLNQSLMKTLEDFTVDILAHELKHMYDNRKSGSFLVNDRLFYDINNISNFGDDMNKFLFMTYFTNSVEALVRPSELYTKMKVNNVSKSNFRDFMSNDKVMRILDDVIDYDLEEDLLEPLDKSEDAKIAIEEAVEIGYERISDRLSIDFINLTFMTITNSVIKNIYDIANKFVYSDLISIFGGGIDSNKAMIANRNIDNISRGYTKYEGRPLDFMNNILKRMKIRANKTKRKLYKLYDMIDESKNTVIFDNDAHVRIKHGNKIVFNFKDFKNRKK